MLNWNSSRNLMREGKVASNPRVKTLTNSKNPCKRLVRFESSRQGAFDFIDMAFSVAAQQRSIRQEVGKLHTLSLLKGHHVSSLEERVN
jgi:hypothetical protein